MGLPTQWRASTSAHSATNLPVFSTRSLRRKASYSNSIREWREAEKKLSSSWRLTWRGTQIRFWCSIKSRCWRSRRSATWSYSPKTSTTVRGKSYFAAVLISHWTASISWSKTECRNESISTRWEQSNSRGSWGTTRSGPIFQRNPIWWSTLGRQWIRSASWTTSQIWRTSTTSRAWSVLSKILCLEMKGVKFWGC